MSEWIKFQLNRIYRSAIKRKWKKVITINGIPFLGLFQPKQVVLSCFAPLYLKFNFFNQENDQERGNINVINVVKGSIKR